MLCDMLYMKQYKLVYNIQDNRQYTEDSEYVFSEFSMSSQNWFVFGRYNFIQIPLRAHSSNQVTLLLPISKSYFALVGSRLLDLVRSLLPQRCHPIKALLPNCSLLKLSSCFWPAQCSHPKRSNWGLMEY